MEDSLKTNWPVTGVPESGFEYPNLIAAGIDSAGLQNLNKLKPNLMRFHDQDTGGEHEFSVRLLDGLGRHRQVCRSPN